MNINYVDIDTFKINSLSEGDTIQFATFFFKYLLKRNQIVFLIGELGSGKTTFMKGLSRIYKIKEEHILSPSFNIVRKYACKKISLYHIDLYRIESDIELQELGLEELRDGFIFIEWANKFLYQLKKIFFPFPIWSIFFTVNKISIDIQVKKNV